MKTATKPLRIPAAEYRWLQLASEELDIPMAVLAGTALRMLARELERDRAQWPRLPTLEESTPPTPEQATRRLVIYEGLHPARRLPADTAAVATKPAPAVRVKKRRRTPKA